MSRGAATRERIICTARELFARKGYAETTTAEIARQADVAEGTIYRHFADKKDLFLDCVLPAFDDAALQGLAEVETAADARAVVRTMLQFRLRLIQENLDSFNILFTQAAFHPELASQFVDRVIVGRQRRVAPKLQELFERGELRRPPNHLILSLGLLAAIWAILNFRDVLAARSEHFADQGESDRLLDDLVDMVLYGIVRGE